VIQTAWREGRLLYKLKPAQLKIYQSIKQSKELVYVVNCSRRLGKTFTMGLIAIETAIQNPSFQIHFGAPYQNALRDFLLPIFNQIIQDCPLAMRPTWRQLESKWVFPNGSYIKLCGANNGQFDNLRGNKSDLFILDEAAQIDDLEDVINSVALPQLLSSTNPHKRIILPSTPPTTPDHPFKKYAESAQADGAYSHFTIYDTDYPTEEIERLAKKVGGKDSTTWKREFLAQFVVDSTLHIVPEWDSLKNVKEIEKDDFFQFYSIVEGLDIGYRDFTAWILGYWDWTHQQLIIEYEFSLKENDFTSEALAAGIKELESDYQRINKTRIRRIADNNNLNLLADLSRLHKLPFVPIIKKSQERGQGAKEWMVAQVRKLVKDGKVIIHPRCKMLIASLEFGIWKQGHSEFARSEKLGHYDFVDAFIYLVAGLLPVIQNINPIPPLYKLDLATTMFPDNQIPVHHPNPQDDELKKLFRNKF